MTPSRENERLSAYVDHDLAPDERTAVERLIEQSRETRQCIDDLRAAGTIIRSLPRYECDAQLTVDIMRQVQSENLYRPEPRGIEAWRLRALRWAGPLAAAVVVAFWFLLRQANQPAEREVALNEAPAKQIAKSSPRDAFSPLSSATVVAPLVEAPEPSAPLAYPGESDAVRQPESPTAERSRGLQSVAAPGDLVPSPDSPEQFVLVVDAREEAANAERAVELLCLKYAFPVDRFAKPAAPIAEARPAQSSLFVIDGPTSNVEQLVSEIAGPTFKQAVVASLSIPTGRLAQRLPIFGATLAAVRERGVAALERLGDSSVDRGASTAQAPFSRAKSVGELRDVEVAPGRRAEAIESRGDPAAPALHVARGDAAKRLPTESAVTGVAQRVPISADDLAALQSLVAEYKRENRSLPSRAKVVDAKTAPARQTILLYIVGDVSPTAAEKHVAPTAAEKK